MSEYELGPTSQPHPAPEWETPDWRRLEVATGRFGQLIADGITTAMAKNTEIDDGTARCIAHALGRAYGRSSTLAQFGRTGEGTYLNLRDEYLELYADDRASPATKELIDWFGTYLVQQEGIGSGRTYMNEHLPPKLGQLLVQTSVHIDDQRFAVHVPATSDSGEIDKLVETLTLLKLPEDRALQAFLSLPDVNAADPNVLESFRESYVGSYGDIENAVREFSPLEDWEVELSNWAADHGLPEDAVTIRTEPIEALVRETYDLVEWKGQIHVFNK